MYAWFWRSVPGPTWLRAVLVGLLVVGVVVVLFEFIFPAVAPYMPFNDGTVDSPTT